MARFFLSLFIGLILGTGLGLYLGWVQFPVEYTDSSARSLAIRYQDDYTVMIANGYLADSDLSGAVERLRLLEIENIPLYVQEVAERYITNAGRQSDIYALVVLSDGLGRLTPIMQPYLDIGLPEAGQ